MGVGLPSRTVARDADTEGPRPGGPRRPAGRDAPGLILLVGGLLAVAVVLRFYCLSDLWGDEALTVNIARLPLDRIPDALRQDGAPPLFYVLLHFWMRVLGTGNTAVRALSGVFGVATLVSVYFVGRRVDDRRVALGLVAPGGARVVAWTSVVLMAVSPFAIRYSTEARMYGLVILLTTLAVLALARALESPTAGRLVALALVTAALLYSHYWAFALLAVVTVGGLVLALRGDRARRRARLLAIAAMGGGVVLFLPWATNFVYQLRHTGTPWGAPVSPFGSWAATATSYGGNAHAAGWALMVLVGLALFAVATDRRHLSVDLLTQPTVRTEVVVAVATVTLGVLVSRVSGTAFEGRYTAVVFPLFVVAAAVGTTVFADVRARAAVLGAVVLLGLWGGVSNAQRNRTQAYQLEPLIEAAGPDDVVVFCPDSIGTDVVRLAPTEARVMSFPRPGSPERIDWVDYSDRVDSLRIDRAARSILRAAAGHTIYFVYTETGTTVDERCAQIADFISLERPQRIREVEPDPYFFEHQGLYRYPPSS